MKVCLIGTGAIAQQAYISLLLERQEMKLTAIVETDNRITADLAKKWTRKCIGPDINTNLEQVEAVIICLSNNLDYPRLILMIKSQ